METNRVTVRYARALLQASIETAVLQEITDDILIMYEALKKFKGFRDFIDSPFINSTDKIIKFKAVFEKEFNNLTVRFVEMVLQKKRETYLESICRNFIDYSYQQLGITRAELITAVTLDSKVKNNLINQFEESLNTELLMKEIIDERLIGGFIFKIDGLQYDASVSNKLKELRKSFQL